MNLAPEIQKMRDAILERVKGKSLSEVSEIVNEVLLNETNNINRLAALSARVQILRDFTKKEFNLNKGNSFLNKDINKETSKKEVALENNAQEKEQDNETWVRVEMLKSGIVNGVRFPEGVVIDVSKSDADKLAEEGLTKIVETTINADTTSKEEVKDEPKKEVQETAAKQEEVKDEPKEEAQETAAKQEEVKDEPKEEAQETAAKQEEVKDEPKEEAQETAAKQEEVKVNINDALTDIQSASASTSEEIKIKSNIEEKKIIKKKSTKITEETIELTDPKAVAEALGLNEKKKKDQEPVEIEEEVDLETLETGK